MTDRQDVRNATFAVSHVWANGEKHTNPGTVKWVRRDLPVLSDSLDMLYACGPTIAAVRAVIEARANAAAEAKEQLGVDWPELTDALTELNDATRADGVTS